MSAKRPGISRLIARHRNKGELFKGGSVGKARRIITEIYCAKTPAINIITDYYLLY